MNKKIINTLFILLTISILNLNAEVIDQREYVYDEESGVWQYTHRIFNLITQEYYVEDGTSHNVNVVKSSEVIKNNAKITQAQLTTTNAVYSYYDSLGGWSKNKSKHIPLGLELTRTSTKNDPLYLKIKEDEPSDIEFVSADVIKLYDRTEKKFYRYTVRDNFFVKIVGTTQEGKIVYLLENHKIDESIFNKIKRNIEERAFEDGRMRVHLILPDLSQDPEKEIYGAKFIKNAEGIVVHRIFTKSRLFAEGVRLGSVLLRINDIDVSSLEVADVYRLLEKDAQAKLTFNINNEEKTIQVSKTKIKDLYYVEKDMQIFEADTF